MTAKSKAADKGSTILVTDEEPNKGKVSLLVIHIFVIDYSFFFLKFFSNRNEYIALCSHSDPDATERGMSSCRCLHILISLDSYNFLKSQNLMVMV